MIAFRANDGRTGNPLFSEGTLRGEWRALAVGGNNFQWLGEVRPFLIPGPEMFRTRGPLDLESAEYAAEFNRVKALGRATGSTRTQNQTNAALFWNENAVAMWTRIARQLSAGEGLRCGRERPVLRDAVHDRGRCSDRVLRRQGALALLAAHDGDPARGGRREPRYGRRSGVDVSLAGSPVSRPPVGAQLLQRFDRANAAAVLRDEPDVLQRDEHARRAGHHPQLLRLLPGDPRDPRARIWGGLHFWTADAQGALLGRRVANFRQEHYFQPE